MSTAEMREMVASLLLSQKDTDRQIKELGKQIGGLGNKFGSFTEGLSVRSIKEILRDRFGINHLIASNIKITIDGFTEEYDILGYSDKATAKGIIVEVKSQLRPEDISQMKRKMNRIFQMLPDEKDRAFEGMIACVSGSDELKRQVLKNGWHLAHIGEDLFELENPPDFLPKIYRA